MDAIHYFKNGYSCSESFIKETIDLGLCDESFLSAATSFSGGMSSGCLCGAIAGAQLVIGLIYGKNNKFNNEIKARQVAAEFILKFKEKYNATCCRILSKNYEFNTIERKEHCSCIVDFCSQLLKEIALSKV